MSSSHQGPYRSLKDVRVVIKIWVYTERARESFPDLDIISLPDWLVVYNGFQRCDAALGPCACGAWHYEGEL